MGKLGSMFIACVLLVGFSYQRVAGTSWVQVSPDQATLAVLDRHDQVRQEITDGDLIHLRLTIKDIVAVVTPVQFLLNDERVASCSIAPGDQTCFSESFFSLGWHWDNAGGAAPERLVQAKIGGVLVASQPLLVRPRPVVMVHGFASDWRAWANYLGPQGYLAKAGLPGFAVGDGQMAGQMNTGSLDSPTRRTNTIHQNAEIVGQYIAQVKRKTGAEMVDLLAHSMGGLISRYYIDRFMTERDVAQLIMLGSPMAGTECANLPASLGLYLPATLEIRPSYVTDIFNRQITHHQGVAFYALAGNPILETFKSPCTAVPTDLAVSQASVSAIPLFFRTMPVLHTELNTAQSVFSEFVLPLLTQDPRDYADQPGRSDQTTLAEISPLQFTRVFAGQLAPGQSEEVVIHIEQGVTVASFALYDTSRSLQVSVRGASGNLIELTAEKNGLVVVEDPAALFYLGYGFQDPRPGEWRVTLLTTSETPPQGAAYALSAYMVGGARLDASATPLLPEVNTEVTLEAALSFNGQPILIEHAQATVRPPMGESLQLDLEAAAERASWTWSPEREGLYGIDLLVTGVLPDGTQIERVAFLSVQAQPPSSSGRLGLWIGISILCVLGLVLALGGAWFFRNRLSKPR